MWFFNIGKVTALRTLRRVAEALFLLSKNMCKWPKCEYFEEVKNGFVEMGFPNTKECIDGINITIPKPKAHRLSYINRKGFASFTLQVSYLTLSLAENAFKSRRNVMFL